jgi:hypothetical protein
MKKLFIVIGLAFVMALTGCNRSNDAQVASHNLSEKADRFQIARRVIFYNGITDTYILTLEGMCSINADMSDRQLEVTCMTGKDDLKKHYLGLSDNVTYFVEQLEGANVSRYHYKVVFKPEAIIPDIDLRLSSDEEKTVSNSEVTTQ